MSLNSTDPNTVTQRIDYKHICGWAGAEQAPLCSREELAEQLAAADLPQALSKAGVIQRVFQRLMTFPGPIPLVPPREGGTAEGWVGQPSFRQVYKGVKLQPEADKCAAVISL